MPLNNRDHRLMEKKEAREEGRKQQRETQGVKMNQRMEKKVHFVAEEDE